MYQKRMSATNIALRACKRFFVRRQIKRTSKTQQFVRGTWQSEQFPKDMLSCVVLCFFALRIVFYRGNVVESVCVCACVCVCVCVSNVPLPF